MWVGPWKAGESRDRDQGIPGFGLSNDMLPSQRLSTFHRDELYPVKVYFARVQWHTVYACLAASRHNPLLSAAMHACLILHRHRSFMFPHNMLHGRRVPLHQHP